MNPCILILVILMAFIGGFLGSMMSGGSLIMFMALTFLSLPVKITIGTLKFSITILGLVSAGTYIRGEAVDMKRMPSLVLFSLLGTVFGSQIVVFLSEEILRILVILLLCMGTVASLSVISKVESKEIAPREHSKLLPLLVGFALGGYIGMLGIASAILTISALVTFFHMPMIRANGTGKMIIFVNNLLACLVYLMNESVEIVLGLTILVPIAIGAWAGAKTALRMKSQHLSVVFVAMATLTIIKLLSEAI